VSTDKGASRRATRTYGQDQLHTLQENTFRYFWKETNPENGLIPDHTAADDIPASIAGVGFALASYPVAVERSFLSRAQAVERTVATLRFFWNAPQGPMPDSTGHQGFFYHFLDVTTGRRAWESELSTIDTAILITGALTAAAYLVVPACGLAMGAKRQSDRFTWLDAGRRLRAISLAGIQRGADSLRARPWITQQSLAREKLRSLDSHLSVEEAVRSRIALRRAAIHASAFACLD
jgi:hypothetical protein